MTILRHKGHQLRVVIDPGVLVSALITRHGGGAPASILNGWLGRRFIPVVSERLLDELLDVLLRPKFRRYVTQEQVEQYLELLRQSSEVIQDASLPLVSPTADPDDDYLVALAIAGQAHVLISGDAHLTSYSSDSVVVLTPRQFVEQLEH